MGKILLIDGNTAFAEFLTEHVNSKYPFLQVEVCNCADKALQLIQGGNYDFMLIDLDMPVVDGLHLLSFATQNGVDKNRIVIISDKDADFLHELCPMGSCLAVMNKFEARQKTALDMIFSSLNRKAANR